MINLLVNEVSDSILRENMKRLQQELGIDQILLLCGWRFVTLTFTAAVTNFKYPHLLSFVPKDILQTSLTGAGSLTWNYDLFDRTNLNITTTGACVVRAFIGRYPGGQ